MRIMLLCVFVFLSVSNCLHILQAQSALKLPIPSVFRTTLPHKVSSCDPISSGDMYNAIVITSIYDTLYEYKYLSRPYTLKPNLAASMPVVSKDGLTYTIELKKGVYFIDDPCFVGGKGREVLASDFIYSIKRHFDKNKLSSSKWIWKNLVVGLDEWSEAGADYKKDILGLQSLGKYKLQIKLKRPYPQLEYTLALSFSALVPKEAVDYYGSSFHQHPVGSGPWKLSSLNRSRAILERNTKYRINVFDMYEHGYKHQEHATMGIASLHGKKLPIFDRIEIHFIVQDTNKWESFQKKNELNHIILPSSLYDQVLKSRDPISLKESYQSKYMVKSVSMLGMIYFEFNMADPQIGYNFDKKINQRNHALRCAIRKGFDWQQRIKLRFHGLGQAFPGIIPPGVAGYDPNISKESITLDIPKAKKLLQEYSVNPQNLPNLPYTGVAAITTSQDYIMFRSWMMQIGYPRDKIVLNDFATFSDYLRETRHRRLRIHSDFAWYMDYPDAQNILQLYYSLNSSPGANHANYNNPVFDELYRAAIQLPDSNERSKLYQKMNNILIDDCVVISGFAKTSLHLWHKNIVMYPSQKIITNIFKYIGFRS